jgi:hypothetical protein
LSLRIGFEEQTKEYIRKSCTSKSTISNHGLKALSSLASPAGWTVFLFCFWVMIGVFWKRESRPMFRVLGFLLILIYLLPFLLSSSLGAGSGKRTQKLLGAHPDWFLIAMKENTAVWDLQPPYVSCIGNSTQLDFFTSMHCFIIRVVSLLSFISSLLRSAGQNKFLPQIRELISYSQSEEILRWRTASTSMKFGQNNDQMTASTWFERCARTPEIGQR